MKIAINGEIVDTNDFWKVSPIYDGGWFASFTISLLSERKELRIDVTGDNVADKSYRNKMQKLEKLRNSIIKIWSENQSTIPQFNLE